MYILSFQLIEIFTCLCNVHQDMVETLAFKLNFFPNQYRHLTKMVSAFSLSGLRFSLFIFRFPSPRYNFGHFRVYFRPSLLPDNGSKNSILNWVLKLKLVQQNFFNPNNVSFYSLIKHWILHIACIYPALWVKIFVSFKFCDCTKLNPVEGEQDWMEIYAYSTPSTTSVC